MMRSRYITRIDPKNLIRVMLAEGRETESIDYPDRVVFFYGENTAMKILLLANGKLTEPHVLQTRIRNEKFDMVLAADGGANLSRIFDITVDVIIGDMDSVTVSEYEKTGKTETIQYPKEKDEIDLELCFDYAVEKGADEIVLVGALGGRMDMTMSNILMITNPRYENCRIEIWHEDQTGWLIRPPGIELNGNKGDTISLIPVGGAASGITLYGMQYPLNNATLQTGIPRGISNVIAEQTARIELGTGLLLAVLTPAQQEER